MVSVEEDGKDDRNLGEGSLLMRGKGRESKLDVATRS